VSIKVKFFIYSFIVLTVLIGGISYLFFDYQKRFHKEEIERSNNSFIKELKEISFEGIVLENDLLLNQYIKTSLKTHPEIKEISIINKQGIIVGHSDVNFWGNKVKTLNLNMKNEKIYEDTKYKNYMVPIKGGKDIIGFMEVKFSKKVLNDIYQKKIKVLKEKVKLFFVFSMILGILFSIFLSGIVTGPVKLMVNNIKEFAEGKWVEVKIKRKDELGWLANEFNKMVKKVKELDELKEDFLSGVTHELRSPLAAIRTYLSLIKEEKRFNPEHIKWIEDSALRLSRFVDDLLDMAKIERGKLEIIKQSALVDKIVSEVVDFFRPHAAKKGLELKMNIDVMDKNIFADPDRVHQVLVNLISNAIKFTPSGKTIAVSVSNNEKEFLFKVQDEGVGIPKEDLESVFEKFHQLKKQGIKAKGTGLGLAICKGLVEGHGGKIWVESEVGKGSVFCFTIPKGGENA